MHSRLWVEHPGFHPLPWALCLGQTYTHIMTDTQPNTMNCKYTHACVYIHACMHAYMCACMHTSTTHYNNHKNADHLRSLLCITRACNIRAASQTLKMQQLTTHCTKHTYEIMKCKAHTTQHAYTNNKASPAGGCARPCIACTTTHYNASTQT